tara:strand:- start:2434 stop:2706 length:273 start_codon:yes stop_codon:yes gene_type:complete
MTWEDTLKKKKFTYDKPQKWYIRTDEYASALPDELVNAIGGTPEKLAQIYKNGLLIDLETDTGYTIKNGKIESINQGGTAQLEMERRRNE